MADYTGLTIEEAGVVSLASELKVAGSLLEAIAVVASLLTVVGGVVLCFRRGDLSIGLILIGSAIVGGLVCWALARVLRLYGAKSALEVRRGPGSAAARQAAGVVVDLLEPATERHTTDPRPSQPLDSRKGDGPIHRSLTRAESLQDDGFG